MTHDREAWNLRLVLTGAIVLGFSLVCSAGYQPAYTTMVENGPSSNRIDMVFMGDGYQANQLQTSYPSHINAMLNHMFEQGEDPFPRYRNFFNVHRIDLVSQDSGADVPPEGINVTTALNASYYYGGSAERLLYIDSGKAQNAMSAALASAPFQSEMSLVSVNDSRYGGGGGSFAVYAGGHPRGPEIALHELGHSFAGLADEYGGFRTEYQGPEPQQANITRSANGDKWAHWKGYYEPEMGTIGAYEGAGYYDEGLYRPSKNSKMRSLGRPFDAVGREQIILSIYGFVDPLDAWADNRQSLVDPETLWVDVIDSEVIDVEWIIDGRCQRQMEGEEVLDLAALNLEPGLHTITAHAFDDTEWVRIDREDLEQSVSWTVEISGLARVPEPSVVSLLLLGLVPLLLRRRMA
ncbi:MAG: hypothetical protein GXY33_22415 [Phycisphaerae bacterium]|nr:hypothetical protein [Phycisphaerae bacterium]